MGKGECYKRSEKWCLTATTIQLSKVTLAYITNTTNTFFSHFLCALCYLFSFFGAQQIVNYCWCPFIFLLRSWSLNFHPSFAVKCGFRCCFCYCVNGHIYKFFFVVVIVTFFLLFNNNCILFLYFFLFVDYFRCCSNFLLTLFLTCHIFWRWEWVLVAYDYFYVHMYVSLCVASIFPVYGAKYYKKMYK